MFPRILIKTAFLASALGLSAPVLRASPPVPPSWSLDFSKNLATLGVPPDWTELDVWQESMTRETFENLLNEVYTDSPESWKPWVEISDTHVAIVKKAETPAEKHILRFAAADSPAPRRFWREPAALPEAPDPARPLTGYRIALDPGHIGGDWAKLEERFFQIGDAAPVQEGDMVLKVALLLRDRLVEKGAEVMLLRDAPVPVTTLRPDAFTAYAREMLRQAGTAEPSAEVLEKTRSRVFAVNAEIRARAAMVNHQLKPDLVLALHFNGEPWGKENEPVFSLKNHLHILVHGCLAPAELAHDDERQQMLVKLLQRTHGVELSLATETANSLAEATGLPAYTYPGTNARRVGDSPYVWARNLLASRIYQCPVVYLEPHVMNNQQTYNRIQAGSYEGKREFDGVQRSDIFTEYADATAQAVERWFNSKRTPPEP